VETPESQYQAAVTRIREHLAHLYKPLFEQYQAAIVRGDDELMAELAEELADAADEAETLWTAMLHSQAVELSPAAFVNEAAGAMAMLSDLWTDLGEAHRKRLSKDEP
jgi:hypothetical protein